MPASVPQGSASWIEVLEDDGQHPFLQKQPSCTRDELRWPFATSAASLWSVEFYARDAGVSGESL